MLDGALTLVDDGATLLADGTQGATFDACESLVNANELSGNIAFIERGGCTFQAKLQNVETAGATAALVFSDVGDPIVMLGDIGSVDIPAVMIGSSDGQRVLDFLSSSQLVEVRLEHGKLINTPETGNMLASLSARGPNAGAPDLIKPDITAPGINILAGHTVDVANGRKNQSFQYLSGTSMSTPHAAGVAALLREAHPDWSATAIKSALMTTAYQDVVRPDGSTPADPFDFGAGHLNPNPANDPGLVYDADLLDYTAFACGAEDPAFSAADCAVLTAAGYSFEARDLNVPSIGVARLAGQQTISRRVTNVGASATYDVSVTAPSGVGVAVNPVSLSLGPGETAEYQVQFDYQGGALQQWAFGALEWSNSQHSVRSPIAVLPVALDAPLEIDAVGATGSLSFDVRFGYTGPYTARVHGLRQAFRDARFVADDAANNYFFRTDNGVTQHLLSVSPNQAYARFALFDEFTDGNDDLDLYLYYCPQNSCTLVGQSGTFSSAEEINIFSPPPGNYAVHVHGFETDQQTGGPGANYVLFAWSFGTIDDVGNMTVIAPTTVNGGATLSLDVGWNGLAAGARYLGAISHNSNNGRVGLTLIDVVSP